MLNILPKLLDSGDSKRQKRDILIALHHFYIFYKIPMKRDFKRATEILKMNFGEMHWGQKFHLKLHDLDCFCTIGLEENLPFGKSNESTARSFFFLGKWPQKCFPFVCFALFATKPPNKIACIKIRPLSNDYLKVFDWALSDVTWCWFLGNIS